MRDTVKRLTEMYGIHEWVIERNAFQRFLTQDEELKSFLRSHGCKLTEHYTNENKYDSDFGIATMAPLFLSCGEPASNGGGGKWRRNARGGADRTSHHRGRPRVGRLSSSTSWWCGRRRG
jgi:hypothetical protein